MPVWDPKRDRRVTEVSALRWGMEPRQAGELVEQDGEWYRITELTVRWPSEFEMTMWDGVAYVEVATLTPINHLYARWQPA